MNLRILAVTGTRADLGIMLPVLRLLDEDGRFRLVTVVTGQHLSGDGQTCKELCQFKNSQTRTLDMDLPASDDQVALATSMGHLATGMGLIIAEETPDIILGLGDRYELLGVASAATIAKVPIAHIGGGDVTEGAFDDAIRHAVSKLSHVHFTTSEASRHRLIQLGENSKKVFNVGNPSLDQLRDMKLLPRDELFRSVGLEDRGRTCLIAFHPPTLAERPASQCQEMIKALHQLPDISLLVTGCNADPGGAEIETMLIKFVSGRKNAVFHKSLGSLKFFSAMEHCDAMVGNSSSALLEAPSFALPAVNIGDRQKGRARAVTVIDTGPHADAIVKAINTAIDMNVGDVENPYGDGNSAWRIVEHLASIEVPRGLLNKSFVDMNNVTG